MTCFRHYDVLAKTPSKMTTAITFSRQNDGWFARLNKSRSRSRPRLNKDL